MTQEQNTENQPVFSLVSQYVRDLSFECAQVPYKKQTGQNDLNLEIGLGVTPVEGTDLNEVTIKLRGSAKDSEGNPMYVVEMEYVGAYRCANIPDDRMGPLLAVDGAALIFPFARQIAMNAIQQGGFAAPMIEPVNFGALYMQAQQQQAAATGATEGTDGQAASA